jgi:diacylglycerol kinase (ATP)
LDVIVGGALTSMDAGAVNGRVFLEAAGAGWDAALFPMGEGLKRGRLGAIVGGLRGLFAYRGGTMTIRLDGDREVTAHTPSLVVANGPYFGSSLAVAHTARVDDGKLTAVVFESFSRADLLAHFAAAAEGRPRPDPRVVSYRAATVEVIAPPGLPCHADGEPLGELRSAFVVMPRALSVFTPPRPTTVGQQTTAWSAGELLGRGIGERGGKTAQVTTPAGSATTARTRRHR